MDCFGRIVERLVSIVGISLKGKVYEQVQIQVPCFSGCSSLPSIPQEREATPSSQDEARSPCSEDAKESRTIMRWLLITLAVMTGAIIVVHYWHCSHLWAGVGALVAGTILDKLVKK